MDLDDFLGVTLKCIKRCAEDLKGSAEIPKILFRLWATALSAVSPVVNAEGKAITPYINYLDSRTQDDVEYINKKDLSIWGKETGNPVASCMFPAMFCTLAS